MDIIHTEMADRDTATGALGLVQAYVNTVDLRDGPEQLADSNTLGGWLVANGLMEAAEPVSKKDLEHAIAVREAIRGLIGAGSGAKVYPLDVATLNEAAVVSRLRARFGADGRSRLEPEARGVAGAMGKLVATLHGDGRRGLGAAQAVPRPRVPLGLLRQLPQPFEPLVQDGLLRQPSESQAVSRAR